MRIWIAALILCVGCAGTATPPQPVLREAPAEYSSVPLYVAGGDIAPPKHINYVDPRVPRALMNRAGENRWKVAVGVVIDEAGLVKEAWFVRGEELLAAPAIDPRVSGVSNQRDAVVFRSRFGGRRR